jgi:N-glycosidase YbiA
MIVFSDSKPDANANRIENFDGKYRFLSNFYPCMVKLDGVWYRSTEHAYQAAKTLDLTQRREIANKDTFLQAKRAGQRVTKRDNWEQIKRVVMLRLLVQKFTNKSLGRSLSETASAELVECNTWGDVYWGTCNVIGTETGFNHLGKLLMVVRDKIQPWLKYPHSDAIVLGDWIEVFSEEQIQPYFQELTSL